MVELISKAVEQGMRRALSDPELRSSFWRAGYDQLSSHATNGISQWIGKRVLMILIAAALSASIGWAVVSGRLK